MCIRDRSTHLCFGLLFSIFPLYSQVQGGGVFFHGRCPFMFFKSSSGTGRVKNVLCPGLLKTVCPGLLFQDFILLSSFVHVHLILANSYYFYYTLTLRDCLAIFSLSYSWSSGQLVCPGILFYQCFLLSSLVGDLPT